MPRKSRPIAPRKEIWAQHYARTGDATYAAEKAGYSTPQPRGAENKYDPAVIARVAQIRRAKLANASIEAIDVLVEGMRDATAPRQARNTAAGIILKYASGDDGANEAKDPHEMTPEELADALRAAKLRAAALETIKADRARPIIDDAPPASDIFE